MGEPSSAKAIPEQSSVLPASNAAETIALPKELPRWLLLFVASSVAIVGILVLIVLLWVVKDASLGAEQLLAAKLDAVKIASGVVVSGGGTFALYLAVRRQRATEADLRLRDRTQTHNEQVALDNRNHQERLAAATEFDALQRRVTELYTKAVEQLGSSQAPVRLGAMYALERLAHDNSDYRQTVFNVLSAYLRMPFKLPRSKVSEEFSVNSHYVANSSDPSVEDNLNQELEVRNTAQHILESHLRVKVRLGKDAPKNPLYWGPDLNVDLSGATLVNASFSGCEARSVLFRRCLFFGRATFAFSKFRVRTSFDGSRFTGDADFTRTECRAEGEKTDAISTFSEITVDGKARFNNSKHGFFDCMRSFFKDDVNFNGCSIMLPSDFGGATFSRDASFASVTFQAKTSFAKARFSGQFSIVNSKFYGDANWEDVEFSSEPNFSGCITALERDYGFGNPRTIESHWPEGWRVEPWPDGRETPTGDGIWGRLAAGL